MKEVHIYIEVDSVSPKETKKWYGYVLECSLHGEPKTVDGSGLVLGTYHRATLTAITEALGRLNQTCEVHIHLKDEFVANMMEQNLDRWAGMGFVTTKGKPVANQEEWMRIWALAQKQLLLTEIGNHTYSGWLQGEIRSRKEKENV